jgi:hypothetical protein
MNDRLARLQLRLKDLRHEEHVYRATLGEIKEEIASLRAIIADIVDRGQGTLPGIDANQGDRHDPTV